MQGGEAHLTEVAGALFALLHAGKGLDLVANLGVGREVGRLDAAATEMAGGLALGGEVLGLGTFVHQPGGFDRYGLAELNIGHS